MIAVLGNLVVDLIGRPVDLWPPRGGLLLLDELQSHIGGNGANCAAALARLGETVQLHGAVGDDLFGRFLLDRLRDEGVNCEQVRELPGESSGVTFVAVDTSGERSFLHHLGANAAAPEAAIAPGTRHFHLASFFVLPSLTGEAAAKLLQQARRAGAATSLDVAWDVKGEWMNRLAPALPHVDWFLPSEAEARMLTGEVEPARMARTLLDRGCRGVVIKRGEQGAYLASAGMEIWSPAFRVDAVDTTGAGDCFVAGFIHAQLASLDPRRALRFACAAGALSVSRLGAVTGLRPAEQILEWMDSQPLRE